MRNATDPHNRLNIAAHVCRLILGAVFVVSGFVKSVDPWGTALKVDEYLSIYGLESLERGSMLFSIWLCGAELMMGLMLTFKVRIRLISIFALCSMTFFTILTFLSATWLPVEDCGCFGEAVKLTPWASFAKNAVLLPMSFVVWYRYRKDKIWAFSRREISLTALFFTIGMGVGTYCWYHLPLIDFLPYKVGVNIAEEMRRADADDDAASAEVTVRCRNRATGEERVFALEDTEWHDTSVWEWMETEVEDDDDDLSVEPMISEFSVRDAEGDATEEIINAEGRLYMLCVTRLSKLGEGCARRLRSVVERAAEEGAGVVCLTPEYMSEVTYRSFGGSRPVRCYNVDATVLKTMLRARDGVVVTDNGTIVEKLNCRDIPAK